MRPETDILLTLPWSPDARTADLDDAASDVYEAIEEHADRVLGPVVAVRYDTPAIEIAFTVDTQLNEEVHAIVEGVVRVVEQHVGVNVDHPITSARAPEDEHPHLLAC
jgi:hypothetical protein